MPTPLTIDTATPTQNLTDRVFHHTEAHQASAAGGGRRLSARRFSLSGFKYGQPGAESPLTLQGLDVCENQSGMPRESKSRLTIMRMSPVLELQGSACEDTGVSLNVRRSSLSKGSATKDRRVSFAPSSFTQLEIPTTRHSRFASDSAVSDAHVQGKSPGGTLPPRRSRTGSASLLRSPYPRSPTLSPEMVLEMTREIDDLHILPSATDSSSFVASPISTLRHRAHYLPPVNEYGQTPSPNPSYSPSVPSPFIPIHNSSFLPFADRPAEVSALLQMPANTGLVLLLRQTFPPHLRSTKGSQLQDTSSPIEYNITSSSFIAPPSQWSFTDLMTWLTSIPRPGLSAAYDGAMVADDIKWLICIRDTVMPRSEAVWVRLASVLGVPLDVNLDAMMRDTTSETGSFGDEGIIESPVNTGDADICIESLHLSPASNGDESDVVDSSSSLLTDLATCGLRISAFTSDKDSAGDPPDYHASIGSSRQEQRSSWLEANSSLSITHPVDNVDCPPEVVRRRRRSSSLFPAASFILESQLGG
ncbi:hypothetical protein JAAARDRAFT_59232 [Jaapia argillacea MUCL 33604]|uniref:Uncharacterized protein n=1 Tax=Jaapia argillacea MUCL 33604 TaxID=933084 RepID=A0A067PRA0_9AGAM|nr:hypothetical protein JAAARDRAFT_59232 [Jaapia argillacea MUCL 33604]